MVYVQPPHHDPQSHLKPIRQPSKGWADGCSFRVMPERVGTIMECLFRNTGARRIRMHGGSGGKEGQEARWSRW
eukprot:scaffold274492_cov19-Tisochrysis_lutea.AAC.1